MSSSEYRWRKMKDYIDVIIIIMICLIVNTLAQLPAPRSKQQ